MVNIILFFKGLIIGMGQIVPGVSGGMLAISLGLYDKCIDIICNLFKDFKENVKFLFPIFIGIITSILLISKIIKLSILLYYVPTMLLFIGLIIGALNNTIKEINFKNNKKYLIITIFIIIILTLLSFVKTNNIDYNIETNFKNFLILIVVGFIYAFATVVPGISSTALMIMIGYYSLIIDLISNLTNIPYTIANINIIIPLVIGLLLGIIYISKLMNYLFKYKKELTQFIILGLVSSSIISMIINTFSYSFNVLDLLIGFILMLIGYFIIVRINNIK